MNEDQVNDIIKRWVSQQYSASLQYNLAEVIMLMMAYEDHVGAE